MIAEKTQTISIRYHKGLTAILLTEINDSRKYVFPLDNK